LRSVRNEVTMFASNNFWWQQPQGRAGLEERDDPARIFPGGTSGVHTRESFACNAGTNHCACAQFLRDVVTPISEMSSIAVFNPTNPAGFANSSIFLSRCDNDLPPARKIQGTSHPPVLTGGP